MGWAQNCQTPACSPVAGPREGWDVPTFTRTEAARGKAGGRLSGRPQVRSPWCKGHRGLGSEPPAAHRLQKGKACPDGDKCRCAHGQEELTEWLDRREVLKQKLAKARKDMLLCPRDDDFGKYNFLLQEDGSAAGATPEAPVAAAVTGE